MTNKALFDVILSELNAGFSVEHITSIVNDAKERYERDQAAKKAEIHNQLLKEKRTILITDMINYWETLYDTKYSDETVTELATELNTIFKDAEKETLKSPLEPKPQKTSFAKPNVDGKLKNNKYSDEEIIAKLWNDILGK